MRSKSTVKKEVNGTFLEDQIAQLFYTLGLIQDKQKVLAVKLDYPGGWLPHDKNITVSIIVEEEVELTTL